MKRAAFAALAALTVTGPARAEDKAGWALVWSDEFDAAEIDKRKWGFEVDCWGGGNEEHQCYTKSTRNAHIEDGKLVITARYERTTGPALPLAQRRHAANRD
ncbi:MAG: hypothetical protein ACK4YM_04060, partial [Novosphingobium sp.]